MDHHRAMSNGTGGDVRVSEGDVKKVSIEV